MSDCGMGSNEHDENVADAAKAASDAQHELFIAEMRARFVLDQEAAALEKK